MLLETSFDEQLMPAIMACLWRQQSTTEQSGGRTPDIVNSALAHRR
jgi:hypothetical protein